VPLNSTIQMQKKISKYFTIGIIIILVIIILFQRSCKNTIIPSYSSNTKIDTLWIHKTDTLIKKVPIKTIVYIKPDGPEYTPGENIDSCKTRFQYLLKQHIKRTVYQDTIHLDSLGTIVIIDTVWLNKLGKRTIFKDYKIPIITKTTTIIKQSSRQVYIGGNLFGDKVGIQTITPGLIYKDRKDRVYQINVGINTNGTITYGVGMFWKIKLK